MAGVQPEFIEVSLGTRAHRVRKVRQVAVVGAGIMGGGIAYTSALAGTAALMKDIAQGQLDRGIEEVDRLLARQVGSGRLTVEAAQAVRSRITPQLDYHGFAAVEPRLYQVSRALGLSRGEVVWKIALPSAMPDILSGMRVGLTIALILAVVGEMLASRPGLGQAILLAARAFQSADLFAGVILLGLIGYVSGTLLSLIEQRLLRWRA